MRRSGPHAGNTAGEAVTYRAAIPHSIARRVKGQGGGDDNSAPQLDPSAIAYLTALLAGEAPDAARNASFSEPWQSLILSVSRANGEGRLTALRDGLSTWANGAEVMRAILEVDPDRPLPGATTWADLAAMIAPIGWAWQRWLPLGFLTMCVADVGTGKSALALRLAGTFILGWPWPDGTPYEGEQGTVLWCETEAAQALNLERARGWGLPLDHLLTPLPDPLADVQLDNPEHRGLVEAIARRPDVRLIVVDSLRGAHRGDENDSTMFELVRWLASLARDTCKPILLAHHLRKRGLQDGRDAPVTLDRVRGSTSIVQPVRIAWALDVPDPLRPGRKRLSVIKSNFGRFPDPIGLEIGDSGISFGAAGTTTKKRNSTRLVICFGRSFDNTRCHKRTCRLRQGRRNIVEHDERAKTRMGIVAKRDGREGRWYWALPARDDD